MELNIKNTKYKSLLLYCTVMFFVLSSLFLSGCNSKIQIFPSFGDTYILSIGNSSLPLSEAKIVMMNIKSKYEQYYVSVSGENFWQQPMEENVTFESYIRNNVVMDELVHLQALVQLSKKNDIKLTKEEKEEAKKAGKEYYNSLTAEEKNYCSNDMKSVISLIEKYILAQKTIDFLTKDMKNEVSDNEARVMTIQEIFVTEEETANHLLTELENGKSFEEFAREYNNNGKWEYNVSRYDLSEEFRDTVFRLETGETTQVLTSSDGYHIIKCINDYDEELSKQNKEKILRTNRYNEWNDDVEELLKQQPLSINTNVWNRCTFTYNPNISNQSFFTLYESYFPNTDFSFEVK